jgi:beta-fructofuranosidase
MTTAAARQQLAGDHHRPIYHFTAPSNWLNDPNGLIHWRGQYHLFYQYNPDAAVHGNIHWGHAVSPDLVHWQDLPIALYPEADKPDARGVWSGCAVNDHGVPTLLYTSAPPETQNLVRCSDDMLTFTKHAANPVIAAPPAGMAVTGFRDPFVWKEADGWYMVVGSGIKDIGGAILLYRSDDLLRWDYLRPIIVGKQEETGTMWECPGFYPVGDKWVLYVSIIPLANVEYFVGTYQDHKFIPEFHRTLDHSTLFYAPQVFVDENERRLMFGWIRESRADHLNVQARWSGMMSIPRMLSLTDDGLICFQPAPELQALRRECQSVLNIQIDPSAAVGGPSGRHVEIIAEFAPENAASFGLKLLRTPDGAEETILNYDVASGLLTLDRSRSTLMADGVNTALEAGKVNLKQGETLRLHIFVDGSVIEVFANGTESLTSRVYPTRPDGLGIEVFATGGSVLLKQLEVWQMAAIWRE